MTTGRCEAITGYLPGAYRSTPVTCHQYLALTRWTGRDGHEHVACAAHLATLRARHGQQPDAAKTDSPEPGVRRRLAWTTPWFRARLGEEDWERIRQLERAGLQFSGEARRTFGPYRVTLRGDDVYAEAVGRSPREAIESAVRQLEIKAR